ncbi:hypothetical protein ACWEGE_04655 [Amycolatopsis sp. NPDC004747]
MTGLETRLRELDLAEPPLGFDTDEVADRAARHTRWRRAGIAVPAVLAFAAFAWFMPKVSSVPPAARPSPPPLAEQARIRQALTDAVTAVLPGLRRLSVGTSPADAIGPGRMAVTAAFADASGRPGDFQLTVYGRQVPDDRVPIARSCPEPGTSALACERIPQPGGAVLVVSETGFVSAGGFTKLRGFVGVLRRADGSTVTLVDAADDAADSVQLTKQQLTRVITDPAFVLP